VQRETKYAIFTPNMRVVFAMPARVLTTWLIPWRRGTGFYRLADAVPCGAGRFGASSVAGASGTKYGLRGDAVGDGGSGGQL